MGSSLCSTGVTKMEEEEVNSYHQRVVSTSLSHHHCVIFTLSKKSHQFGLRPVGARVVYHLPSRKALKNYFRLCVDSCRLDRTWNA